MVCSMIHLMLAVNLKELNQMTAIVVIEMIDRDDGVFNDDRSATSWTLMLKNV